MSNVENGHKTTFHFILAILACFVGAGLLSIWLRTMPSRQELGASPILFAGWGCALLYVLSFRDRVSIHWLLPVCAGLVIRAMFIDTPPLFSDDLYRYAWEGMVFSAGENPLLSSPDTLATLDPSLHGKVNHSQISSIYPPMAQWWFWLLHQAGGQVATLQLLTSVVDVLIILIITGILFKQGRSLFWALCYALHPLPVVESAVSAHVEFVALMLALLGLSASRHQLFAIPLTILAAAVKLFPALWLPQLIRQNTRRQTLWGLAGGIIALGAISTPFLTTDVNALSGFMAFSNRWEFNGFSYPWMSVFFGTSTRTVLMTIAGLASIFVMIKVKDPTTAWYWFGLIFVLSSPTMHPWYGLWLLIPAILLQRRESALASVGFLFSYGVFVGYSEPTETWIEPVWLWWITWVPVATLLAVDGLRHFIPTER